MSNQTSLSTPDMNRVRAAAALIPTIESGLLGLELSLEGGPFMASFCEWTVDNVVPDDPEAVKLAETVGNGLKRIKTVLSSAG